MHAVSLSSPADGELITSHGSSSRKRPLLEHTQALQDITPAVPQVDIEQNERPEKVRKVPESLARLTAKIFLCIKTERGSSLCK